MALVGKYLAIVLALAATNCGIATADRPIIQHTPRQCGCRLPRSDAFSSCAWSMPATSHWKHQATLAQRVEHRLAVPVRDIGLPCSVLGP